MNSIKRKIGILGGGQLGRMLFQSITDWDIDMWFLDKDKSFPAGRICPQFTEGSFNSFDDVISFAKNKDVISIEIENVNTIALKAIEESGTKCYPQPHILNIIKDKGLQKLFYDKNKFSSSPFQLLDGKKSILEAIENSAIKTPFVQKARTEGYDGRGVQLIKSISDKDKIMDVPSVIEDLVDIQKELSIIVARNEHGQVETFPLVEMVVNEQTNQLDYQLCPARVNESLEKEAKELAEKLINQWEMVGILAIELFLDNNGNLLINEVAPRPHNSGHHSIEACNVSQFEQLSRCLLGLELIQPSIIKPSVMINLVGHEDYTGEAIYEGVENILNDSNIHLHIYGKSITKPHRKMGHITILDDSLEQAMEKSDRIREKINVIA